MIFSTVRWARRLPLLAAAAIVPASCGSTEARPEARSELETRDAAPGAEGKGGAAGTGGTDAIDSGACGKEFEPCCGSLATVCEARAGLSCNDSACVSCDRVPSSRTDCVNVAPRGTATAVLTRTPDDQAPDYGPRLAIDENVCNVWASGDYAANPEAGLTSTWWEVDLGTPLELSTMTLWLAMTPAGSVDLKVEHSLDRVSWQTLFSGTRAMSGHSPWFHDFPEAISTRHVRVSFQASPSWISIRELALFQCSR